MKIIPLDDIVPKLGISPPALNCLKPNEDEYKVLLIQPEGHIVASHAGVRNRDPSLATEQFASFLREAVAANADLVIAPEYSTPWNVIANCIEDECLPHEGALWVLGCESIRLVDLAALAARLTPRAILHWEEELSREDSRFTDPLAYIFRSRTGDNLRTVILVQFKTTPMGDPKNFEVNNLLCGSKVYKFGGKGELSLVSIVCSDAFSFEQHAKEQYDRSLIIHIQLNRDPRHCRFRLYRDQLFQFRDDSTELICLNWAKNIVHYCDPDPSHWENISGSAWYAKSQQLATSDDVLNANHRRGLYYTWLDPARTHALFFNFAPAMYTLSATKAAHIGVPAPKSYRRGPRLLKTHFWDHQSSSWAEQVALDDGFSSISFQSGPASHALAEIAKRDPLELERLLALSAGEIGSHEHWYDVRYLDSMQLDSREIIRRLTFCQDPHEEAKEFRIRRLQRCARLWTILGDEVLPQALRDLKGGFTLAWSGEAPHQNVTATTSKRRATAVYLGEGADRERSEGVRKILAEHLRRSLEHDGERRSACQRLVVWFLEPDGKLLYLDGPQYRQISTAEDVSEFDIGRPE